MSQSPPKNLVAFRPAGSARPTDAEFYRQVSLIRYFEDNLLKLFAAGKLMGTTHTYSGQEANAVGLLRHLEDRDVVFSNHRCHGHYLARTGDVEGLLAELLGMESGICGGKGGSQHLCRGNFYTNGVQGSIAPLAVGAALGERLRGTGAVTVVWLGDGTMGEGVVYEAFNMASLWKAPVIFAVENNRYAQTTPVEMNLSGSIAERARAFGIPFLELETTDPAEIWTATGPAVDQVRTTGQPHFVILNTYRFGPHSKGDDFRSPQELAAAREKDPMLVLGRRIPETECARIRQEVAQAVDAVTRKLLDGTG